VRLHDHRDDGDDRRRPGLEYLSGSHGALD
jgi:hypothetical protein